MAATEVALYTRQMASPSKLATGGREGSRGERRGVCGMRARRGEARDPEANGYRHWLTAGTSPAVLPTRRTLPNPAAALPRRWHRPGSAATPQPSPWPWQPPTRQHRQLRELVLGRDGDGVGHDDLLHARQAQRGGRWGVGQGVGGRPGWRAAEPRRLSLPARGSARPGSARPAAPPSRPGRTRVPVGLLRPLSHASFTAECKRVVHASESAGAPGRFPRTGAPRRAAKRRRG